MKPVVSVALGLLVCLAVPGCGGGSKADGPPRLPVKGKVTFDGAPVGDAAPSDNDELSGGAMITFVKQGGQGGTRLRLVNGEYSAPAQGGLEAGTYRVEINWMKATGKMVTDPDSGEKRPEMINAIPEKYNKKSTLTAEVAAGKSQFDFELAK